MEKQVHKTILGYQDNPKHKKQFQFFAGNTDEEMI
jgi:hypothetical protein